MSAKFSHCPKCGAEVAPDAEKCGACGESLTGLSADLDATPPGNGATVVRHRVTYAGFWLRAVAYLMDLFVLAIVAGFAILKPLIDRGAIPADNPWFMYAIPFRQALGIQLLFWMILWLYFASFESSRWQATPGKKAMGLVVTDLAGRRVSFTRASVRNLAKHISEVLFLAGYVMAAFTKRKQALHDMLAGCLVLRKL